jgi:hypothetical protein
MTSVRGRSSSGRRRLLALSAAIAALALAAPVSGASAAFTPIGVPGGQANAPSGCIGPNVPPGVGVTVHQICGAALAFIGPTTGQVATAIGPTIIGSTIVEPITVSPAPVAVTSLP